MRNRWSVLAVLFFARTAIAFQFQSVAAVAPLIGDVYGVGLADIGLLIGLYFAPGVLVAIPDSTLAARLGDRRVVIAAMVLMPLGGALMWAAYNASIAMVFSFGPVLLISRGWTLTAASSAVSLCMVIAASLACAAILLAARSGPRPDQSPRSSWRQERRDLCRRTDQAGRRWRAARSGRPEPMAEAERGEDLCGSVQIGARLPRLARYRACPGLAAAVRSATGLIGQEAWSPHSRTRAYPGYVAHLSTWLTRFQKLF